MRGRQGRGGLPGVLLQNREIRSRSSRSPVRPAEVVAGLLLLLGGLAAVRGSRRVSRGLRAGVSLELVRGLRAWIMAFSAGIFATALLAGLPGLAVLGLVFLAEELYETRVLVLIVRLGERGAAEGA
jgi:hypothetical protein